MSFAVSQHDHPVQIELPVQWGEMDSFQHVNNIIYFRYFETARIAYFKQSSVIPSEGSSAVVGPILAKTNCTFIFPLRYPDRVLCTARTVELLADRFLMEYHVYSIGEQRLAAKGSGLIVSYDYAKNEKVELPLNWRAGMLALQPQLARSA